jgi:hypothetical protein
MTGYTPIISEVAESAVRKTTVLDVMRRCVRARASVVQNNPHFHTIFSADILRNACEKNASVPYLGTDVFARMLFYWCMLCARLVHPQFFLSPKQTDAVKEHHGVSKHPEGVLHLYPEHHPGRRGPHTGVDLC